jgi:hypothetical protein
VELPNIQKTTNKIEKVKKYNLKCIISQIKFFDFNENKGISAFKMYALKKVINSNTTWLVKISSAINESEYKTTRGKLIINKVLADVGKPINEFVCQIDIKKLANL